VIISVGLAIFPKSLHAPFYLVASQCSPTINCCFTILGRITANTSLASGIFSSESGLSLIYPSLIEQNTSNFFSP